MMGHKYHTPPDIENHKRGSAIEPLMKFQALADAFQIVSFPYILPRTIVTKISLGPFGPFPKIRKKTTKIFLFLFLGLMPSLYI